MVGPKKAINLNIERYPTSTAPFGFRYRRGFEANLSVDCQYLALIPFYPLAKRLPFERNELPPRETKIQATGLVATDEHNLPTFLHRNIPIPRFFDP